MRFRTITTTVVGASLALACLSSAGVAHAATPTPTAPAGSATEKQTRFDGPPPATWQPKIISTTPTGEQGYRRLAVVFSGIPQGVDVGASILTEEGDYAEARRRDDGTWRASILINDHELNHLRVAGHGGTWSEGWSAETPFDYDDQRPTLKWPTVTYEQNADKTRATFTIEGLQGSQASISGGGLYAGTTMTDKPWTVVLPTPNHETWIGVSLTAAGEIKQRTYILNGGMGDQKPVDPVVEQMDEAGAKTALTVSADPKSVLTVKGDDGKVLAVRAVGATGSTSVLVPTGAEGSLMATRDGVHSDEIEFDTTSR